MLMQTRKEGEGGHKCRNRYKNMVYHQTRKREVRVIKLMVDTNKGTGMYVNADKKRWDSGRS